MTNVIDRIDPKNPSREDLRELMEELKRLKEVDVRSVDGETLADLSAVRVREELPLLERTIDYLKQIRNPYCYRVGGVIVKVSYLGEKTVNECLKEAAYAGGMSNPEALRGDWKGGTFDTGV